MSLVFSSCKEDEPPAKPKLSFESSEMTVSESAGTIEVEVLLDHAASEDITVEYTLEGTALDLDQAGLPALVDYSIDNSGEVEIEAGSTSGIIEIAITGDNSFEPDETIIIEIDDVSSENVDITSDDEIEITITNDDQKAKASFAATTLTINEVDDATEIVVQLDNPVFEDVKINYTLTGTARDSVTAKNSTPQKPADYAIRGATSGQVEIKKGTTSGTIKLEPFSDRDAEADETIIITLDNSTSSSVEIGTNKVMNATLAQEDGLLVILEWGTDTGENYTDVDMDLFLWLEIEGTLGATNYIGVSDFYQSSLLESTESPEFFFLPSIFVEDGDMGLSATYFSGTASPMNFDITLVEILGGEVVSEVTKSATYTTANVNEWTNETTGTDPVMILSFTKSGTDFTNISEITVPASGSRLRTSPVPSGLKRQKVQAHRLPPIFQRFK